MNILIVQIEEAGSSHAGNDTAYANLNASDLWDRAASGARPESTLRLQLEVRVRTIDAVDIGRTLRTDTGGTIGHRGTEQAGIREFEADVPPSGYLTASLSVAVQELLAAITTMPHHTKGAPLPAVTIGVLQYGPLLIEPRTREVSVGGRHVRLTRKEFDLLHHLASHPNQVIRREQIMADIWGDGTMTAAPSRAMRTIDTHINSLRGKLDCRTVIETVRGVGFRFVAAEEGSAAIHGRGVDPG